MSVHAVLFDLDGTLLDTADDLGNALNYVLKLKGLPTCTSEVYRCAASHGSKGLLELGFGDQMSNHDFEELKAIFLDHYESNICEATSLFPETEELLQKLNEQNIPWGVVTNKPGFLTDQLLPSFDIFKHSKINVSGDTLEKRKPHPEPLLHAANVISVEPRNVLYVGDAERDISAANAANMTSVIADYGYISENDTPENWQANLRINSALELLKHL